MGVHGVVVKDIFDEVVDNSQDGLVSSKKNLCANSQCAH